MLPSPENQMNNDNHSKVVECYLGPILIQGVLPLISHAKKMRQGFVAQRLKAICANMSSLIPQIQEKQFLSGNFFYFWFQYFSRLAISAQTARPYIGFFIAALANLFLYLHFNRSSILMLRAHEMLIRFLNVVFPLPPSII